jgi:hypothetical protein
VGTIPRMRDDNQRIEFKVNQGPEGTQTTGVRVI